MFLSINCQKYVDENFYQQLFKLENFVSKKLYEIDFFLGWNIETFITILKIQIPALKK